MPLVRKKVIYLLSLYLMIVFSLSARADSVRHSMEKLTFVKKDTTAPEALRDVVKITRSWNLPPELKEISGIDYIDSTHLICVQDEIGSIFIYNLSTSSVESQIPFGPPGDYEAIAMVKDVVYVACADGRLFEIANYNSGKPVVKEYGTHLTVKQNVEGLSYDPYSKLLLVAIKGQEEDGQFYKGIYGFDPVAKKMPVKPVIKIDLQDPVFGKTGLKKLRSVIQPSELAVHPLTGDIFVLDAVRPQLLVISKTGDIKDLYLLNKADFNQPEGIAFSPSGECLISDVGNKQQPARLLLVEIRN